MLRSLLPDALHPNPDGYDLVFSCLSPLVDSLMDATASTANASASAPQSVVEAKSAAARLLAGTDITFEASPAQVRTRVALPLWGCQLTGHSSFAVLLAPACLMQIHELLLWRPFASTRMVLGAGLAQVHTRIAVP